MSDESTGVLASLFWWLVELFPGVRRADVSGDGEKEIVVGPHPKAKSGRFFRHFGSISLFSIGSHRVVVGVA